ncbi:DUF3105 domain-containing protein [Aquipuribacter sp. SD81]|uniref:DUF3105 domain-containing protein n=1 Tax=Aquipuribacter sp. SD81 TaxID=3127703 RepID=UPI003017EE65
MPRATSDDRQARLAKMQAAQRSSERRRSLLVVGVAALVSLLLIGVVVGVIVQSQGERSAVERAAAEDIDGVEEFDEQDRNHVQTPVEYAVTPPVGGDHTPDWQTCGFYDTPITTEPGVHSLEHGAVWVTYDPELPAEQVAVLEDLAERNAFLLVSPWADGAELPSPVVASSWQRQLALDSAEDERLEVFIAKYMQNEELTPELGAACSGGRMA